MIRNMKVVLAAAAVVVLAVGAASVATSSPEGTAAIKARHEAMEAVGDAMGPLGAIAKAGTAPIQAVYEYGEIPQTKGLVVMDSTVQNVSLPPTLLRANLIS